MPVFCLNWTETHVQYLINPLLSCKHMCPASLKWAKDNPLDLRKHAALFCLNRMHFGRGQPLAGSSPRWCIKVRSSWCWQCADDKPGLKEKCWGPREPQRPCDCSAIIPPMLSCEWKEIEQKGLKKKFCHVVCQICSNVRSTLHLGFQPTLLYSLLRLVCLVYTSGTKKSSQHFILLLIKWQEISTLKK